MKELPLEPHSPEPVRPSRRMVASWVLLILGDIGLWFPRLYWAAFFLPAGLILYETRTVRGEPAPLTPSRPHTTRTIVFCSAMIFLSGLIASRAIWGLPAWLEAAFFAFDWATRILFTPLRWLAKVLPIGFSTLLWIVPLILSDVIEIRRERSKVVPPGEPEAVRFV